MLSFKTLTIPELQQVILQGTWGATYCNPSLKCPNGQANFNVPYKRCAGWINNKDKVLKFIKKDSIRKLALN